MLTVKKCLKHYYIEHVIPKVVARERIDYAITHLERYFNDIPVAEIDIPMCRLYSEQRPVAPGTIRRELGVLSAAINHCLKWRHLKIEETSSLEIPPSAPPKCMWLYEDELKALFSAAEGRAADFILLAYYTAARKNAIETLECYQVDLVGRRINLAKRGERQTTKRKPIVPIGEEWLDRLANILDKCDSNYVLGNNRDIRIEFDIAAKKANLSILPSRGLRESGRLSPHILRHSRATHLLQRGKNPFAVANLLGDTLTTVLRVYGHACPDYMAEAT